MALTARQAGERVGKTRQAIIKAIRRARFPPRRMPPDRARRALSRLHDNGHATDADDVMQPRQQQNEASGDLAWLISFLRGKGDVYTHDIWPAAEEAGVSKSR
jgi:hypothetical protein